MPRRRRRFCSLKMYELCFRAHSSIPFTAHKTISLLIESCIARTQRDDKVTLCHDIWNGSHCHILVVSKDASQLANFYGEIQKRVTDYMKRLLGLKQLNLWEGRTMVAEILDINTAIARIAYLYSNPAQDDLEDSIDRFPGLSSFQEFQENTSSIDACTSKEVPWVRLKSVPKLKGPHLNSIEDSKLKGFLCRVNQKNMTELVREPNAWMKCFNVESPQETAEINESIFESIKVNERAARKSRKRRKRKVFGAKKLRTQRLLKSHQPKKKSNSIFVLCHDRLLRIAFIKNFNHFESLCKRAYEQWKLGNVKCSWPPGALKPAMPILSNSLVESFA